MKPLVQLAVGICLTQAVMYSADRPDVDRAPKRPRLGVALAGGAALGLAHIGVLEWLEEHRIPVDYIAGTSMGALVGGLHATGMTSSEVLEFARQVDWQQALSSTSPYNQLAFRRKEDQAAFPVAFEIGLKGFKPGLPSGLSAGQGVGLILSRFAAPYSNVRSFDDLPTPFRCVASDLQGNKGVVFDKGSLFEALRASMSLPALFSPVTRDGMVLVDGALTDNLPVDVVKAMGADYTIAVALDLPSNAADYQSLLGVASRSISYMIAEKERAQMAAADLVIMPVLKGLTSAEYTKFEEFRKIGYEAAAKKANMLRQFQVSEEEYRNYTQARQAKRHPADWQPDEVRISDNVPPKLRTSLANSILPDIQSGVNQATLEAQMLKITGTGAFDTASYEFVREGDKKILAVRVSERGTGPVFVRPGLFVEGASGDGMRFGIGGRVTFLNFGGPGSEWRNDLAIGAYNVASTEYYYRIQGGKWILAPRASYQQTELTLYNSQGQKTSDYDKINYAAGADLGYAFGRFREFRAGYEVGYLKTTLDTGVDTLRALSGQYGTTRAAFRRDTRDNPLVPTEGSYFDLRASWFDRYPGVNRAFPAYEGVTQKAYSLTPKYSLALLAAGGTTVNEYALTNYFAVGGLFRMSSLSHGQLLGNNYYLGSVSVRRGFSVDAVSMFGKFYGVLGYEVGRAWQPHGEAKPRHDGIVGLEGATRIGLIFFGASVGDQGSIKALLRVGRAF